jgi:ParB family chromosome partitioning protein
LPESVRAQVAAGELSMGHARAILALEREEDQVVTARQVVARGSSVRDTELLVKHVADRLTGQAKQKDAHEPAPSDVHTRHAEDRMKFALGTRVTIKRRGPRGVIQIEYASEDELQRIYELLVGA